MTPAQLLKKMVEPPKVSIEPPFTSNNVTKVADFAAASGLSVYGCIKQKTCPICGSKGITERYEGTHPQKFFYCDRNRQHIYEFDDDAGTADRVPM
jgi:hypothetical protein